MEVAATLAAFTLKPAKSQLTVKHNFKTISNERARLFTNYPELYTKTHNGKEISAPTRKDFKTNFAVNKELFKLVLDGGSTISCTKGYFKSNPCSAGNVFLKAVYCGRDYCENCGEDGSPTHLRRMARWMTKVQAMKSMAYMVVTIPEEIRYLFRKPAQLTEFRTFIKRKLQRDGYTRGLIRYHYFGDCKSCKGKGCNNCNKTGVSKAYNPHLNILTEGGHMNPEQFKKYFSAFRESLTAYFFKVSGKRGLIGNINYQYTTAEGKKMHQLKYVTRATHRNYNHEIAEALKGYRTTSTWGKWPKASIKNSDATGELSTELISIVNGFCPCCADKLKWNVGYYVDDPETGGKKFKRTLLKINNLRGSPGDRLQHMEAGYYQIINN